MFRCRVGRHIQQPAHHRAAGSRETHILHPDAARGLDFVREKATAKNQRPAQKKKSPAPAHPSPPTETITARVCCANGNARYSGGYSATCNATAHAPCP